MLKWTVGQRIPSSASSTNSCWSEINSTSPYGQNTATFKLHPIKQASTVQTAYVRNLKTADKENRTRCRKSSREKKMVNSATSASVRNRDSIYMQLDDIPAALRDVSNHWSPGCEINGECETSRTRRRTARLKKSPCVAHSHKRIQVPPEPSIPPPPLPAISSRPAATAPKALSATHAGKNVSETSENPLTIVTNVIEKKKRPCNGDHRPVSAIEFLSSKSTLLVDNPLYFTIQTSPPEEPDEFFHKVLPAKRARPSENCDIINNAPLVPNLVCDNNTAVANLCETVSNLTKNLSWLKLNGCRPNGELVYPTTLFGLQIPTASSLDISRTSSLDITNSNSAAFSDTNASSTASTTASGILKRKLNDNANTQPISDTVVKLRSKRRCVIFSERSYPLNTPPAEIAISNATEAEDDGRVSLSTSSSFDGEKPSTLRRQKAIRRKTRRGNFATVPQSIYNKNLKSWLTLPAGVPSPFEISESQFMILGATPMSKMSSTYSCNGEDEPSEIEIIKKAMSTPKPNILFDLTDDIFLSPGVRPLLDSVMRTSSENDVVESSKRIETTEETYNYVSPLNDQMTYYVLPEQTWNSHGKHLAKTPDQDEESLLVNSIQSSNSKINDDQDVISSIVSSTPTLASTPTTTMERQSRSRRCLSFGSPPTSKTTTNKQNRNETGQLDLRIYYNNGLMTVHIIRAHNLHKHLGEHSCNAYVKVNLIPQDSVKSFHRTCVRNNSINPKFDHKFSMEISECDLNKRVLISTWHRDRGKQKSEFLGCMSFAIKNILKKGINGRYKLLSHNTNKLYLSQISNAQDLMAGQTTYVIDDKNNVTKEAERFNTTNINNEELKSMTVTRHEMNKVHEEYMFLQHLELDKESDVKKAGRTPFTTTHKLNRLSSNSYGFSIAWTHPPRVERVEANLPAEVAGLKPGDNVIFVNKTNVVTLSEEKILDIIKSCGNQLTLEIYRKPIANGTVANKVQRSTMIQSTSRQSSNKMCHSHRSDSVATNHETRSTTAYSTATATSTTETSKKRLQLPQITFSSEDQIEEAAENTRQHFVYQLLKKEQQYALCLQFGISRFLLPLAERRDVIRPNEHQLLFQNVQELLRITEDLIERTVLEEGELFGRSIGKIYLKKLPVINSAYRRYCCGLKKADCILVEKTRCGEFMRLMTDPPIPKKRPDLVSFIHKPLQHYRDVLKLLQVIANCKETKEHDHHVLAKLISELQAIYRDITVESGLMDCGAEGRPILSLQDLESRLVFTRCKPFALNTQGRKWIFGGDLSRVEGKSTRMFWVLLFSDILLFTKINRDRVVFVTEEPLSLATVNETQFNIKKRDTEFKLIIGLNGRPAINRVVTTSSSGNNSPAQQGCVSMMHFHSPLAKRSPQNKDNRLRTLVFRAPSPELKAVWQNLIQRQVIKINTTGQGITPATSPMESPNQPMTTDSETTSTVYKRQCDGPIDDIIEHKCKLMGKNSGKGRAFHLAKWMKGELDGGDNSQQSWSEPEIETWSDETFKRRTQTLNISDKNYCSDELKGVTGINLSRALSPVIQSDESVTLCKKCHETCLQTSPNGEKKRNSIEYDSKVDPFLDSTNIWANKTVPNVLSPTEPFAVPEIAVMPPDTPQLDTNGSLKQDRYIHSNDNSNGYHTNGEIDNDNHKSTEALPYKCLNNNIGSLKRYSSMCNLNKLSDEDTSDRVVCTNTPSLEKEGTNMNWVNKASYFVSKIGENVQNSSLLGTLKYLRPFQDVELSSTSQTLAFEEECNSGGTSGDEFWGTPNSGGASVASNERSPLSPTSSRDGCDDDEDNSEQKIMEEMITNRTTAMLAQQHNMTPSRMLQNKLRLEPLPEAEEENTSITRSSSSISSEVTSLAASDCTMSCPVAPSRDPSLSNHSYTSHVGQPSSILSNKKLRRSQSVDESGNELEEIEKKKNTTKQTNKVKKSKLLRFFSREVRQDSEEKNEITFWRRLRRRQTT